TVDCDDGGVAKACCTNLGVVTACTLSGAELSIPPVHPAMAPIVTRANTVKAVPCCARLFIHLLWWRRPNHSLFMLAALSRSRAGRGLRRRHEFSALTAADQTTGGENENL